jgi:hypothetical protein
MPDTCGCGAVPDPVGVVIVVGGGVVVVVVVGGGVVPLPSHAVPQSLVVYVT